MRGAQGAESAHQSGWAWEAGGLQPVRGPHPGHPHGHWRGSWGHPGAGRGVLGRTGGLPQARGWGEGGGSRPRLRRVRTRFSFASRDPAGLAGTSALMAPGPPPNPARFPRTGRGGGAPGARAEARGFSADRPVSQLLTPAKPSFWNTDVVRKGSGVDAESRHRGLRSHRTASAPGARPATPVRRPLVRFHAVGARSAVL